MSVTMNDGIICPTYDELDGILSKIFTVYMLVVPNGKRYVGMTRQNLQYRFGNGTGWAHNKQLTSDIREYGWDNIERIVCCENLTLDEACVLETELIREFNTTNPENGYNRTAGGDYFRDSRKLIPEQEQMNDIIRDAISKLANLIQK